MKVREALVILSRMNPDSEVELKFLRILEVLDLLEVLDQRIIEETS